MAFSSVEIYRTDLFAGRTALVTGGGDGIGGVTARAFASLGADVVLTGNKHMDDVELVAKDIEAMGVGCLASKVNIRETEEVDRLRDEVIKRFGGVDFVINNAGGQFLTGPGGITDRGWRAVIDLNLNGTWNMCSRFAPVLAEQGRGSIVNMATVYALDRGAPMMAHSGAARAGVISLTRSLAPYLEAKNATVNVIAPGSIVHPKMAANYGMTMEECATSPWQSRAKVGSPEDVAAIMIFLCSPAARMINGSLVVADATQSLVNWPITDDFLDAGLVTGDATS